MALGALLSTLNLERHEPALRDAGLSVNNLCHAWQVSGWSGLEVLLRRAATFQTDGLGRARFGHALVHSRCAPSTAAVLGGQTQIAATVLSEQALRAWPFMAAPVELSAHMRCRFSSQPQPEANVTSCTTGATLNEGDVPLFVRWEEYVPKYLASVTHVRFVQIGANCGMNTKSCAVGGDPVWNYVESCGWRGLAFEPVPGTFQKLCRNIAAIGGRVRPIRAIISNETGSAWMKIVQRHGGEKSHVLPTPQRDSIPWGYGHVMPSLSLYDVWPQDGADVLIVDAEGSEERILGYGPLPLPLPQLVLFEHNSLSESQKARIDANLLDQSFHHIADLKHMDAHSTAANLPPQDRLYGRLRVKR